MAYNPFAGHYSAVDNHLEEYRFNDLGTDRRQSYPGQGPLSSPAHAQYSTNAVYSQSPQEPFRNVSTAYGGPGSTEYSSQYRTDHKYATNRPASIGSTWSGYGNEERAWNELPADVQGIQTRSSWAQRMSVLYLHHWNVELMQFFIQRLSKMKTRIHTVWYSTAPNNCAN